jgi:hypothetical protein
MNKKRRKIPLRLHMEEALLRRLPPNHEKWAEIRRNFKKGQAGYKGEIELDFHLGYTPRPLLTRLLTLPSNRTNLSSQSPI